MGEHENSALKAASKLKDARENSGENNKKVVITFVVIMAISLVLGFFAGYFFTIENAGESLEGILTEAAFFLKFNVAYIALIVNIVACIACFMIYAQARALYKNFDGEDEDVLDKAEEKLFYTISIPSIMMVLNFLLFGITMCSKPVGDEYNSKVAAAVMLSSAVLIFSVAWEMLFQGMSVSLLKKMNPEKRGNVLDFGFDKKWLDSCDEAQKLAIYKASYVTNSIVKYIFVGGFFVTLIANDILHFGMFPIILVSVMWLIHTVVYSTAAYKNERGKTLL